MALRFVDSFDHYTTDGQMLLKWTALNQQGSVTITSAAARFATTGGLLLASTNAPYVQKTLEPSHSTWIVGFAFRRAQTGGASRFLVLLDNGSFQVELGVLDSGVLRATRNNTMLADGTTVLSAGVWYFIEAKVVIADAGGTFDVHLNGVSEISFTGDTKTTANAWANQIRLWNEGFAGNWDIDDLYVLDGSGAAPVNDFLGDCRVECLLPSGNGNSSQFTGSDGNSVDNYLLVDETSPDSDTTYVESATLNDKDTYAYADLASTSGTVYGVCPIPHHRKTTSGSKTFVSVARLGGGTEEDSAAKVVYDSYLYSPDYRSTRPGGGAWTIADVNGAEFGIKVAS